MKTPLITWLGSALLLAVGALGTAGAQQAPLLPLLQEGKKTLYQRVLTTPNCSLHPGPNQGTGMLQPTFTRFYVYERDQEWLKVGPDSTGNTSGWLPKACTVEWKMQLSLAFTNPANRDRLLFFKERDHLETILDAPDPVSFVAPLREQLKKNQQTDGVLAQEPEYFIDLQQQFYLLPILSGEEVMTEGGFRTRILNIASVSKDDGTGTNPTPATNTSNQLREFNAAVVFVIDSTISMDPYIERTRHAIKKIYEKIEAEHLGRQVKFGLVSYRNSVKATPNVEYLTRVYANPSEVVNGEDFLDKIKNLKQATASTASWSEDTYAGMMEAIQSVQWNEFGARYIVLVTDAGALDGDNPLSSTKLEAQQVREEARKRGVAIYTLHLKTPKGTHDHAKAEGQYYELSHFSPTNTNLYYPVDAGDVDAFGQMVDSLADAITNQVKVAYMGGDAVGSATFAEEADPLLKNAALIGHAMQLAYLGSTTGAQAPPVFQAWISDRDLIKQQIPTTDVRVLLTKAQLSDLRDILEEVVQAANEGLISPSDMFSRLRSIAATMGADPNQVFQEDNKKLAELGIMGEYLEDLPYQSDVLSLDEDTWISWDGLAQEKFIRTISTKLRHYRDYNADTDHWVALAPDSDPRDYVYPIPLEMMP